MSTADVHELILENSPFDQYLKSLDIDQDQFQGDILSLDDFNDAVEESENDTKGDDHGTEKSGHDGVSRRDGDGDGGGTLNRVEQRLMEYYQSLTTSIVDSNILHPFESPFINQPNNSLHQTDQVLPPLYPLSLYNIQIDGNSGNDEGDGQQRQDDRMLVIEVLMGGVKRMKWRVWAYALGGMAVLVALLGWMYVCMGTAGIVMAMIAVVSVRWKEIKQQNVAIKRVLDDTLTITKTHIKSLAKAIHLVREVELISRGYRLSTPLTPIERLEVSSPLNGNKSEKSLILRAGISRSLRSSIALFRDCIQSLTPFLRPQERVYVRSQLSDLFNDTSNNDTNNDAVSIEEMDTQLPILTLKAMLQEYEIMVSNYFTIVVFVLSKVHLSSDTSMLLAGHHRSMSTLHNSLNQVYSRLLIENNSLKSLVSKEQWDNKIPKRVLLSKPKKSTIESFLFSTNAIAESLNSMSPLFSILHSKIAPLEKQEQEDNNNGDQELQSTIDLVDILAVDEVVNDFVKIKQELSQCMRNWENANRALIKIVRSIPIEAKDGSKQQWDQREAEERVKRLLDKLRGYDSANLDYIAEPTDPDQHAMTEDDNYTVLHNTDETIYEAESGFLDETIEKPLSIDTPVNHHPLSTANDGTVPATGLPPPPPPPPLLGMVRKAKPSKRTVFDPLFDPQTNQMKKKNSPTPNPTEASTDQPPVYNYRNLIPPEKKVINELLMVLDTHKNNNNNNNNKK
ncbi:hypothetical protein CYY_006533 [Polysphondylium violaceum]|uniref:Myosin-binding domain-containing protein n=1 Tax=Polysphondylium violaceum TaxID=133409 RepID=A0A8J4PRR7_9MYCE|nr:hypothetical protein CYY_006533 [Polysphondylium violaceum]